ncbi:MAG: hypothetical protein LKI57_05705 [Acetobacter lovaniensis]|nr:hypothetical protein [Acetobacter lovaniensis]
MKEQREGVAKKIRAPLFFYLRFNENSSYYHLVAVMKAFLLVGQGASPRQSVVVVTTVKNYPP